MCASSFFPQKGNFPSFGRPFPVQPCPGSGPLCHFDRLVPHCPAAEEAFSRHMRQVEESSGSLVLVSIQKYQVQQWLEANVLRQATRVNCGRQAGAVEAFPEVDSVSRQATRVRFSLSLAKAVPSPPVVLAFAWPRCFREVRLSWRWFGTPDLWTHSAPHQGRFAPEPLGKRT